MSEAHHPAARLKHLRIAATLEQEIRAGRVRRGGQLPGENALADRFAVSRNTVRQALSELNRAGLIATRSGKGSFVTYDGALRGAHEGWATALGKRGISAEVSIVRLEPVTDEALASSVGCAAAEFIAVDRLRRMTGGPVISYEQSRIPAIGRLRDLPAHGLVDDSLSATLFAAGLVGECGEQWVSATQLSDDEARLLGRSTDDWFLRTTRVSRTAAGDFVEHVESALDPRHFQRHLQFD